MKNINVFVYGTLLSEGSNPASAMVDAEVIGRATVPGVIYDLGWFPGFKRASVVDEDQSLVHGELIRVDEEGLERLDAYEGCPSLYHREETTVILTKDDWDDDLWAAVPAYIYIYNGNVHEDDRVPTGEWIGYEKALEDD